MSKLLKAKLISQDLWDYLLSNPGHQAKVHSVYMHAVNLLMEDGALITLATSEVAVMPMGIIVDLGCESTWHFKNGDTLKLDDEILIRIDGGEQIDLSNAQIWDPAPIVTGNLRSAQALVQIREELIDWLTTQPKIGLLPLISRLNAHSNNIDDDDSVDAFTRYIAKDLADFVENISSSDWQAALEIARKLVGFGIGSTPSCDDFLVAYLAVFAISLTIAPERFSWVSEFNQGIVDLAKKRTTLVSAHMLEHAASGKVSRSHQRLIHACLYDTDCDLVELMYEVGQTGASSGTDFLLGLTCSLAWFIDNVLMHPTKGVMEQVVLRKPQPVTIL